MSQKPPTTTKAKKTSWRSWVSAPPFLWSALYAALITVGVAFTLATWSMYERLRTVEFIVETRATATNNIREISSRLELIAKESSHVIHGFMAAFLVEPEMSQDRFAQIAELFIDEHSELRHIAMAPDLVIRYVYPLEGNEAALGLDYRSTPNQYEAVLRAQSEDQTVLAGPITLVQGGEAFVNRGVVNIPDTLTDQGTTDGVISVVMEAQKIFKSAGLLDPDLLYDVSIRGKDGLGGDGELFFGDDAVFTSNPVLVNIDVPGGSWQLAAVPKGGWPDHPLFANNIRVGFISGGTLFVIFLVLMARMIQLRWQAETRLSNAIGAIDDGFVLFGSDDRLVLCNERYREMTDLPADVLKPGISFEEILRLGVQQGRYPEATGRVEEWLKERIAAHRSDNAETEQKLEDGRWLKITESLTPEGGVVGFFTDVSELKNAKEAAEQASHAKSEFLNIVSHELRTPLGIILGYISFFVDPNTLPTIQKLKSTISEQPLNRHDIETQLDAVIAELARHAEKMNASGDHLLELINSILDLSKLEAAKIELDLKEVSVRTLVPAVVEQFEQAAEEKELEIFHNHSGEMLLADETRVKQVLVNLIANAIKFTDEGSITVKTSRKGDFVEFSVTDTGCGIPQENQDDLFDMFTQVDASLTRKVEGTGLGLAIAKKLTELHGGDIGVSSAPGQGSTFWFTIPAK